VKLTEVGLTNFRQFRGEQRFPLSVSDDRNVTLLFGANGSGKTTLLNAFTWALYGEMSQDVEAQERLITDYVWREATFGDSITVAVEVSFEHQGVPYRARRAAEVRKSSDEQGRVIADLQLWSAEGGQSKLVEAPQQKVDSILPKQLSRFFFFNGERIDKLVHRRAYAEVKQDIKTLLGLEQVERALIHLPKVERKLSGELKRHGGEQAAEIQGRIEVEQDRLTQFRSDRNALAESIADLAEEREAVLDLLRKHAEAGPLQSQRDETDLALRDARAARDRREAERRQLVATRGYLAFAGELAKKSSALAAELHERGSLPAPLKREFVDSLLQDCRCICGTELIDGTAALRHVRDWRDRAGLAEVEAAWQRLSGQVSNLGDARTGLRDRLQSLAGEIENDRTHIYTLEARLTELQTLVRNLPMEEVGRLEVKREDLQRRSDKSNQDLGIVSNAIQVSEIELEKFKTQLKSAEVGDELAQTAKRRLELVQSVEAALQEILDIRSKDMKERLGRKVKEVFAKITVKPFYPVLNDDFELGLYQDQPNGEPLPVPKSTGENQILSLSFVAAISELAREVSAQRNDEGVAQDWGTYPIVMDAAFGSLDLNYQRDVSRALADMAPQMIVLVSKSQGQGEVFDELRAHVRNLGVIVTHSTNTAQTPETIEFGGRQYPYIATGASADWAELKEIHE
jgi:DNA sulfur modification protein DndD